MSKSRNQKRKISSLLKSRPKGRFAKEGFDLLGEGDVIKNQSLLPDVDFVSNYPTLLGDGSLRNYKNRNRNKKNVASPAIADKTIAGDTIGVGGVKEKDTSVVASSTIAPDTIVGKTTANKGSPGASRESILSGKKKNTKKNKNSMAKDAIASNAIARKAIEDSAVDNLLKIKAFLREVKAIQPKGAIAKDAVASRDGAKKRRRNVPKKDKKQASNVVVNNTIAPDAIARNAIVSPFKTKVDIKKDRGGKEGLHATKPKFTGKQFQKLEGSYVAIDRYIIDVLFSELKNPFHSIVYIYLWRRSIGEGTSKVRVSLRAISEMTGVSKRCVQEALKRLHEMNLIKSTKEGLTGIPNHEILEPWKKQ